MSSNATPLEASSGSTTALDDLHHMAIEVQDIAATVDWYTGRFRCRIAYQDSSWALLEFANTRLAFVLPGDHPPHVALVRENAARFGRLSRHRDGSESVYIDDPSGNAVEIIERDSLD